MTRSDDSERLALAETLVGVGLEDLEGSAKKTEDADPLVGTRLDHFVLERPLGQGGMGSVYVAHDTSLDRRVAIKMLRGDLDRLDQEKRLLFEARAQARLNHPNVVHIYFIGRRPGASPDEPGPLYLAMEWVEGQALDRVLEAGGRLSAEHARQAMLQVARGLRAARRAGIIHRDVKPSNLIQDAEGILKVADFGLARPVEGDVAHAAEEGIAGSPLYMAPEQVRGQGLDHRADMYSLGATFFHLITGRPPYEGESAVELLTQHLQAPPPSVQRAAPDVPRALARIVERLMAKSPGDRFDDYDQLIAALEEAAPEQTTYAGFWIRAAGTTLDLFVAALLIAFTGWFGAVLHLLHVTVGHAYGGQTFAKYLLRIHVRRLDGSALGIGRSAGRTLLALWMPLVAAATILLSQGLPQLQSTIEQLRPAQMGELQQLVVAMAISHGFLSLLYAAGLGLAAFHPEKRAAHDLLVGSVVTYRLVVPAGQTDPTLAERMGTQDLRRVLDKVPGQATRRGD
ncbi:MAG: protein kinase domain-containing protein [Myxococcota bacterium]